MLTRLLTAMARREKQAVGVVPARPRVKAGMPRWLSFALREPYPRPPQEPSPEGQPPVAELHLKALEPELISGLLGRWHPKTDPEAFVLARIQRRTRFILIGLAAVVLFFGLAYFDHGLTNPSGTRTAISLIFTPVPEPAQVSLALLQDPVGLIAIVMTMLTPILFADQVSAIGVFNQTNEQNIIYRADKLAHSEINSDVQRANKKFDLIGRGDVSVGVLVVSAAASFGIDYLFHRWGLFSNWNKTELSSRTWTSRVYIGWWANPSSHLIPAIALWALGCYFFYFVIKQVYMGAIFAIYIHRIMARKFGVSPDMIANTDGFWGLSAVRRFMLATYISSLGLAIMIVGILIVWLPFNAFSLLMIAVFTIINSTVVIYPTSVGHAGARAEKMLFVKHILPAAGPPTKAEADLAEAVWNRPLLPFRVRSTLTTVTVSLLFPFILVVVSRLFGG